MTRINVRSLPMHHREAGTTVLELLLALSLVAAMLTMIFGSFSFGRRAWETADRVESQSSVDQAQSWLRQIIAEARPTVIVTANGRQEITFRGDAESISFVADLRGTVTTGGLHDIRLSLEEADDLPPTKRLVAMLSLYRPSKTGDVGARDQSSVERIVIDHAQSIRFRYFGSPNEGERAQWHHDWVHASAIPELIAIDLAFPPDDHRRWRPLAVRPELR